MLIYYHISSVGNYVNLCARYFIMFVLKHFVVVTRRTCLVHIRRYKKHFEYEDYNPKADAVGVKASQFESMLERNPKLANLSKNHLKYVMQTLMQFRFTKDDVICNPSLLSMHVSEIKNRVMLLEEFGLHLDKITPEMIIHYNKFHAKKIFILRAYGVIPANLNIVENVFKCLGAELPNLTYNEYNDDLKRIYMKIYRYYMDCVFGIGDDDTKLYGLHKHTSFRVIHQNVYICKLVLNFTDEMIISHMPILHQDPANTLMLINALDGLSLEEIMVKNRYFVTIPAKNILNIQSLMKECGLSDKIADIMKMSPSTFTMKEESLRKSLMEILSLPQLQLFSKHRYCLSLAKNLRSAKERLLILDKLKIKSFTMRTLCCSDAEFIKVLTSGSLKISPDDVATHIGMLLNKDIKIVEKELKKHLCIYYVPVENIKQTLDFLIESGYSNDLIFKSIQILLCPVDKVRSVLENLDKMIKMEDIETFLPGNTTIPKQFHLQLTLYFLERDTNFSGSNIWSEDGDLSLIEIEETEASPIVVGC